MAAQRCALKKRADRPAAFIECHNDIGWPVRTLVRIRDDITTLTESPRMTSEFRNGAPETVFKGKLPAVIPACGERYKHDHG
jgi:hypothetical protein